MKTAFATGIASLVLAACASDGDAPRSDEGYIVTGSNIPRHSAPTEVKSMGRTDIERLQQQAPAAERAMR